jgi:hypothetical protein
MVNLPARSRVLARIAAAIAELAKLAPRNSSLGLQGNSTCNQNYNRN